uniref:Uncharacterized protein n=1 Tax=Steinernema glaseri TaxID=37863 RepID=A0A1I8AP44_9BILA
MQQEADGCLQQHVKKRRVFASDVAHLH